MLLWELVSSELPASQTAARPHLDQVRHYQRLPYDTRCSARTKAGRRCRGKIRQGTEFCPFHDPAITPERRRRIAAKGGRSRNPLAHMPDGYLRKIKNRADVGHCMDRLYREVRLGVVTPQMGSVLFNILCRLLDSGIVDGSKPPTSPTRRSKASRIRPKIKDLLTPQERADWKQAIAQAPPEAAPQPADDRDKIFSSEDLQLQADDPLPGTTRSAAD